MDIAVRSLPVSPGDYMNPSPDAECELPYAGQADEVRANEESFAGLVEPDHDGIALDSDHDLWWDELREYGGEG